MKKYIAILIMITMFVPFVTNAQSYLSTTKIEIVVRLLKQLNLDNDKIIQIVNILKKREEPKLIERVNKVTPPQDFCSRPGCRGAEA